VRFLVERQEPGGGWPREALVGVFNRTCLINYDNYRHYFPLWAIAEWSASRLRGGESVESEHPPARPRATP
jgi:squalene cyclase